MSHRDSVLIERIGLGIRWHDWIKLSDVKYIQVVFNRDGKLEQLNIPELDLTLNRPGNLRVMVDWFASCGEPLWMGEIAGEDA